MYAFGIIANELFSLELPFHDCEYSFMHQLEDKVSNGWIEDWKIPNN